MPKTQKLLARVDAASSDTERLLALVKLAHHFARAFRAQEGLKAVRDALALAKKLKNEHAKADALVAATLCHYYRGDHQSAVATGLDAYAAFATTDQKGRGHALTGIGMAFFAVQDYDDATDAFQRAAHANHAAHEPLQEGLARTGLAFAMADSGRYKHALRHFRGARKLFHQINEPLQVMKTVANIGHVYRKWGDTLMAAEEAARGQRRFRHALRLFKRAREFPETQSGDEIILLACIGEMRWRLGNFSRAEPCFMEAMDRLEEAPELNNAMMNAIILIRWGKNATALGDWERGEALLKGALRFAEKPDAHYLRADCHEALAVLYRQTGKNLLVAEELSAAREARSAREESLAATRVELRQMWKAVFGEGGKRS